MQLTWYSAAALILREGDSAIAFDPFCGFPADGSLDSEELSLCEQEFAKVENVFVTHGHFDHIARVPSIYKNAPLKLRCTLTPYKTLLRHKVPSGQMQIITSGESVSVGPFTVTAYQGRHCRYGSELIVKTICRPGFFRRPVRLLRLLAALLRYPENGETLFYEVQCGGKRVQIMGSLNLTDDIDYPTGADWLILPFQGRSNLEEYGLGLVKRLKPKEVFLDHYDDAFAPLSAAIDTKGFEKILQEQEGIPCRSLKKGEIIYG